MQDILWPDQSVSRQSLSPLHHCVTSSGWSLVSSHISIWPLTPASHGQHLMSTVTTFSPSFASAETHSVLSLTCLPWNWFESHLKDISQTVLNSWQEVVNIIVVESVYILILELNLLPRTHVNKDNQIQSKSSKLQFYIQKRSIIHISTPQNFFPLVGGTSV